MCVCVCVCVTWFADPVTANMFTCITDTLSALHSPTADYLPGTFHSNPTTGHLRGWILFECCCKQLCHVIKAEIREPPKRGSIIEHFYTVCQRVVFPGLMKCLLSSPEDFFFFATHESVDIALACNSLPLCSVFSSTTSR